jgi:hypothetical protein
MNSSAATKAPMPAAAGLERVPLSGRWKDIPNKTHVWTSGNQNPQSAEVYGRTYEQLSDSADWRTEVYGGNHMIMIDDVREFHSI